MLLLIQDTRLSEDVLEWTTAAVTEGVLSRARDVAVVTSMDDSTLMASSGCVVIKDNSEDMRSLKGAAGAAAAVIWITAGRAEGVRPWLGLDTGHGYRIPVAAALVSDEPVEKLSEAAAHAAVKPMVDIRPDASPKGRRKLRSVGKTLAAAARKPLRFDPGDAAAHRTAARKKALSLFSRMLDDELVEEYQIQAGSMQIHRSDNVRVDDRSPFATEVELAEAIRALAAWGADRPHRFDESNPRLDIGIGERWRLHAEGFVVSPMNMVLRSNMGGSRTLAELGFAAADLNGLLVEAVAGAHRANMIIAATMAGGKTTLCQALLKYTPDEERIDTIEDTPELRLREYGLHTNTFERLTRDANADGAGGLTMTQHLRDAKRGNASKLVVGEVRGEGTLALLDAMSSGMSGCLATLHSPPGAGVLEKLVAYAMTEEVGSEYARRQIAAGLHLLIWLGRNGRGERVIADVTEIAGVDDSTGNIITRCLWQLQAGDRHAAPVGWPLNPVLRGTYKSVGLTPESLDIRAGGELRVVDTADPGLEEDRQRIEPRRSYQPS